MLALPSRALPAALILALGGSLLVAAPARADDRVVIHRVPAMRAQGLHGTVLKSGTRVEAEVVFDLQDPDGAEALATAASTPGSAGYRQYTAPADWIARFAPTQQDVDAFTAAAKAAGLTVTAVPDSRLFAVVEGDADAVEGLFRTDLKAFRIHGVTQVAAASDVSLPRVAGSRVAAVAFDRPDVRPASATAAAKTRTACSSWWGEHRTRIPAAAGRTTAPTAICGYSARQLRATAGLGSVAAGADGDGQTVAVIDAFGSSTIRADLATYSRRNGLPAARYAETVPARSTWDTATCSPEGWRGEQTLDLQAIHAIAPKARLRYVGTKDCAFGFDVALSQVLDRGLATIVSNSWGGAGLDTFATAFGAEATLALNTNQHLQAAAEGIGLYFASGDSGDDSPLFGQAAVDFPASSPWVTAVGGTTVALDRENRRVFTTAWGDAVSVATQAGSHYPDGLPGTFAGGAGGGTSSWFAAPAYQGGAGMRTVADVAALADPFTGFATGLTEHGRYRTSSAGGTSLATPVVAAQVALAQQESGRRLGFLNPALYAVRDSVQDVPAATGQHIAAVDLGKKVAVVTFGTDTSLATEDGYDLPTGLGELTPATLAALGTL